MATLTIRQLDENVYDCLKAQARANNRSLEAEARTILEERAKRGVGDHSALIAELRAHQRDMVAKHGVQSDSVALIRAVRDEE